MKIQVQDKSRNGEVIVRNFNSQRRVEKQLDQILERIKNINNELRSV